MLRCVELYDKDQKLLLRVRDTEFSQIDSQILGAATRVDASGCTGLTELALPAATRVDASGCTGLTEWCERYQQPGGRMEQYLTGGGKALAEVCAAEHWDCHDWSNCPTVAAYGARSIGDLPPDRRVEGALFIALFDAGLLRAPVLTGK